MQSNLLAGLLRLAGGDLTPFLLSQELHKEQGVWPKTWHRI